MGGCERKKVLCVLTVVFFGLMLFGTLFHQKIDGMFRKHVSVVSPEPYQEEVVETWEVDGEVREARMFKNYLLVPKEAVWYGMVYVLETVEVPYGSYEVVRLKNVERGGEQDAMVKVQQGLSNKDRVVAVFCDTLMDGMRVVESKVE